MHLSYIYFFFLFFKFRLTKFPAKVYADRSERNTTITIDGEIGPEKFRSLINIWSEWIEVKTKPRLKSDSEDLILRNDLIKVYFDSMYLISIIIRY